MASQIEIILRPVKAFTSFAIRKLASTALKPGANIVSDGLACFAAVTQAGCLHTSIKTGSGKQAVRTPAFKWVNTALGNIKAALVGTYRAVRKNTSLDISRSSNIDLIADTISKP